ncbi:cutinase family protein [Herbiconiux oxytropis]|uniref:cutinase family protein n=1 Tax=Herbiconiux oxytropis TaxID=2970915 RepID=UPI00217EA7A1|nr:cutinase family protein [Herbiconiux oxytropis]
MPFKVAPVPTVSGSVKVGASLTAKPGVWSPVPAFSYQWKRAGVGISGATKSTYVPVAADVGKKLTVTVTGKKTGVTTTSKTSAATVPVAAKDVPFKVAPVPTVSGAVKVGATLTAKPGVWSPVPAFSYQWKRAGAGISGATKSTYVPVAADVGKTLTVTVTGKKTGVTTTSKTSAATVPVAAKDVPFKVAPVPTVSGAVKVGATLTAKPGVWSPVPAFSYQWKRAGVGISGATKSTYVPVAADVGKTLTVTVTGQKTGVTTTSKTSAATAPVVTADKSLTATPVPIVTGTARVGSVLTADAGSWAPAPVAVAYQWIVAGMGVSGATNKTFVLPAEAAGKTVTVAVTGSKAGYTSKTTTSVATAMVEPLEVTSDGPLVIDGKTVVGEVLSVNLGRWSPSSLRYSYQWSNADGAITGATSSTYKLTPADAFSPIQVAVTGSKAGYSPLTRYSDYTAEVHDGVSLLVQGTISTNTAWNKRTTPVVIVTGDLTVAAGKTLTIGEGVVVKFDYGVAMYVPGALVARGSARAPVIFTARSDNSFGGDTRGGTDQPVADSWEAIYVNDSGKVDVTHLESYFGKGFFDGGDEIANGGGFTIADSTVTGSVSLMRGGSESSDRVISLTRNTITDGTIRVELNYPDVHGAVEIADNVLSGFDGQPIAVRQYDLRPSKLGGNTVTGTGINAIFVEGTLVEDWTVPTTGMPFVVGEIGLTIPEGIAMTVLPGTVLKFDQHAEGFSPAPGLTVQGSLSVPGTFDDPVVMTYYNDTTVGGDLGEASGELPPGYIPTGRGDMWQGIIVENAGVFSADNLTIRKAGTACGTVCAKGESTVRLGAVDLEESAAWYCLTLEPDVTGYFHGSVDTCEFGIRRDVFIDSETRFDARSVQWGDGGPPGFNENPQLWNVRFEYDARLDVYPWRGVANEVPLVRAPTPVAAAVDGVCSDVLFVGMMGSGERSSSNTDFLGSRVREILVGASQAYVGDGTTNDVSFNAIGIDYEANAVPILQTPGLSPWGQLEAVSNYVPGAWDGSVRLIAQLEEAVAECGATGQKIVLAGYSQGAWAIHAALNFLEASDSPLLEHIAGVALLADPLRFHGLNITNTGVASPGDGFAATFIGSAGIAYMDWLKSSALAGIDGVDNVTMSEFSYPSSLVDKTVQLCSGGDAVCDTSYILDSSRIGQIDSNFAAGSGIHGSYSTGELRHLGAELRFIALSEAR